MSPDILAIVKEACEAADKAAKEAFEKYGDMGTCGYGYVRIESKHRALVNLLKTKQWGGLSKGGPFENSGFTWQPMTNGYGQAMHIGYAAARAAAEVLIANGIDTLVDTFAWEKAD